MSKFKTTKYKLLKLFIPLIILISFTISFIGIFSLYKFSNSIISEQLDYSFKSNNDFINEFFLDKQSSLDSILNTTLAQTAIKNNDFNTINSLAIGLNTNNDAILRSFIANTNNKVIASPSLDEDFELSKSSLKSIFDETLKTGITWFGPYTDAITGDTVITLSKTIKDIDETILGLMALDIKIDGLADYISEKTFGKTGHTILLSKDGTVLSAGEHTETIGQPLSNSELIDSILNNTNGNGKSKLYNSNYNYKFTHLVGNDLVVLSVISTSEHSKFIGLLMLVLFIIASLGSLIVITIINNYSTKLTKNINSINSAMNSLGQGNLSSRLNITTNDEFELIANSFNTTISNFKEIISENKIVSTSLDTDISVLNTSFKDIESASNQISNSMNEVSAVYNDQTIQINNILDEVDGLSSSIDIISESIKNTYNLCGNTDKQSNEGLSIVNTLVDSSNKTLDATNTINTNINLVKDSSEKINKILVFISTITNQTNLLALNASIEAAQAGEHGKGFSVVASEIRKLAEQSKLATQDISDIVNEMNVNIKDTTLSVDYVTETVSSQSTIVNTTETLFSNISESISDVDKNIKIIDELKNDIINKRDSITSSLDSLAAGIEESSASTLEVTSSTQEQTAIIDTTGELINKLVLLGENLKTVTSKFKN